MGGLLCQAGACWGPSLLGRGGAGSGGLGGGGKAGAPWFIARRLTPCASQSVRALASPVRCSSSLHCSPRTQGFLVFPGASPSPRDKPEITTKVVLISVKSHLCSFPIARET